MIVDVVTIVEVAIDVVVVVDDERPVCVRVSTVDVVSVVAEVSWVEEVEDVEVDV